MKILMDVISSKMFFGTSLFFVCDIALAEPVTAFMAAYGGYISAAMSAVSAVSQAQQQKSAAKYNQKVAENQAIAARQQAASNAEMQRRSSAKKIGSMQAAYAASGVSLEGSALDVLEESARNAELDRQNILYGGELRAMGSESTAALEKSRGDNAMSSGYLSAAGSLFKGASVAYGSAGAKEAPFKGTETSNPAGTAPEFANLWREG
jgi:hypothetical protein